MNARLKESVRNLAGVNQEVFHRDRNESVVDFPLSTFPYFQEQLCFLG